MNASKCLSTALLVAAALAASAVAYAAQGDSVAGYKLLTTISLPGGLAANDISWVDSSNARYYLSDHGNAAATPPVLPRVVVIDTQTNQFLTSITVPASTNGLLAIPRTHEVWVGLNDSTVAVINTDTNTIAAIIPTGGTARADEMAYDPIDRLILVANDKDNPPFVSFISQVTRKVVKKINYDGVAGPQSTGGIEQPVWDAVAEKFYLAIPATKSNPNGEVDELDPVSLSVTRSFPSACKGPAGLVLIPHQRLMTSCGDAIDILSGKVLTTVMGVGGDEIWYNRGDQRVYFGGGTDHISVNVVDANSYAILASLTVGQIVASPGVSQKTHSLAADSDNNELFVPVSGVGVQVWRNGASITAFPNPVPVSIGSASGATTIFWNAPNADAIEIHIGAPNGPLFTYDSNSGSASTGPWVSDGMTFYLQDVTGGAAPTAANTLATLVIHLKKG